MGVAKNIEERLESLMEGFFARVFRSGLQPVEVGRRIVREMDAGRTISVNRIYCPNEFTVVMGPDDYARFEQMEAGLQREFSELVIQQAKENRWNLMGMPRFSLVREEGIGKGRFRVDASLAADPDGGGPQTSTRVPHEGDPSETRAISVNTADRLGLSRTAATLEVLDDSGEPQERITVTRTPVTIGRLSGNDIVLSDPNVSRRHAELRRESGRWTIVDLGSTNGTVVDGKLAREHSLQGGERISFGTIEVVFKLADETR